MIIWMANSKLREAAVDIRNRRSRIVGTEK